jgi:hypothetical protein
MSDPTDTDITGGSRTEVAQEEASKVASTVHDQASMAAGALQQGGQQIVGEAKQQVAKLSDEAQRQIHAGVRTPGVRTNRKGRIWLEGHGR